MVPLVKLTLSLHLSTTERKESWRCRALDLACTNGCNSLNEDSLTCSSQCRTASAGTERAAVALLSHFERVLM